MPGDFLARLAAGSPLLLDSAMGSELDRRGLDVRLPLWSARALVASPGTVLAIHRENVAAGADILTANTFRTQRRIVGERADELTRAAVALARQAASESPRGVFVAGSIAPLADCYRPDLVPDPPELEREHREHAQNLAAAGADLILVETMNSIRELLAAGSAAAATGLPFVVSAVTNGRGKLLSGEPLETAIRAAREIEPAAAGVNCVDPAGLSREVARLASNGTGIPIVAYGNVLSSGDGPDAYAEMAAGWVASGARIVGGCCGTTPGHTGALRKRLDRIAAQ
ncbi:MAG TPA: homocysteine S-methyltransferase family protein [Thermoanaerobaculia bacterium]|nr:homocysteine S-methyltransferase family protein [Thermoanaerobaculia bacterium]